MNRIANGGINSLFELVSGFEHAEVTAFTNLEEQQARKWKEKGCQIRYFRAAKPAAPRMLRALLNLLGVAPLAWSAVRCILQFKPSVILCNDIRVAMLFLPLATLTRTPLVFFIRDIFQQNREYPLRWRFICANATLCLCLSTEMRTQLESRIKPLLGLQMRLEVVPSVVDFTVYHPQSGDQRQALRTQNGIAEDQFVIICVAAVCAKKKQYELLEIIPELGARIPNAHVHFVGDFRPQTEIYAERCRELVTQLQIDKFVTFHGYACTPSTWYQLADCTVLASEREGLARCMIESLSCGTPVVSFAVTSAREVLEDGNCGIVVETGDYQGLVDALVTLFDDPDRRQKYSLSGIKIARECFRRDVNSRLLESCLRKVSK